MEKPNFISKKTFMALSWKLQDFIYFLYVRKMPKETIKRKLYIDSERQYQRYRNYVGEIIKKENNNKDKLS